MYALSGGGLENSVESGFPLAGDELANTGDALYVLGRVTVDDELEEDV
jgi:hypothetical protein